MVKEPMLTIITPVYNGEKYIRETIDSVLNSKIVIDYEYIVLDDGSKDSSLRILQEYKGLIQIYSHENIGESETINRGLSYAQGKYILVINADDPFLSSELIPRAIEILNADPLIAAVYPDWKIIDEKGVLVREKILPEYSDTVMIGHCRCLPGPGTIFRKELAIKIAGRNSNWKYVSDYDFWLRLSRVGRIVRLPGILAQWRENTGSISVSQKGIEMSVERIQVIQNFLQRNKVPSSIRRMALGNCHYLAARLVFFNPEINGKSLLITAIRLRRCWPEEAKFYVVIYIFFMPVSTVLLKPFRNKIISKVSYK